MLYEMFHEKNCTLEEFKEFIEKLIIEAYIILKITRLLIKVLKIGEIKIQLNEMEKHMFLYVELKKLIIKLQKLI